jgi:hypothetical protein
MLEVKLMNKYLQRAKANYDSGELEFTIERFNAQIIIRTKIDNRSDDINDLVATKFFFLIYVLQRTFGIQPSIQEASDVQLDEDIFEARSLNSEQVVTTLLGLEDRNSAVTILLRGTSLLELGSNIKAVI